MSESIQICPVCEGNSTQPIDDQQPVYLLCTNCDYLFLEPSLRLELEQEQKRYQEHNNDLEDPKYVEYLKKTWDRVSDQLEPGSLVIDYGCGPTRGLQRLLQGQDLQVVSYDPIFYPTSVDVLKGNVDVIFCSEAIEHMYQPKSELERWQSLLKPEGLITLRTAFHKGSEGFREWWYKDDPTHIGFFSVKTFEWISKKYDLEILHMHSPYVSFRK
jgi:hypothetical protein